MDQKGLFDEEEGKPIGDEFEGFEETPKAPKKSNKNLMLGIGILLIVVALAVNFFLLKKEEPAAPPAPVRIPIKEAPVMGNVTAVAPKVEAKVPPKVEIKKAVNGKVEAKKEVSPKVEVKKEVPKAAVKKTEEAKVKVPAEVKPEAPVKEGIAVVIGTYAAMYEIETAREKLKGIPNKVKETKRKLMMNRIIAKEVNDKGEAKGIVSDLKEKGYDPFVERSKGVYKVYAVSNLNEAISDANKADLEKLGYAPVVEKKEVRVKVYQLIAGVKSEEDAKSLSGRLEKLGFKPEMNK